MNRERELKFDVPVEFDVPDVAHVVPDVEVESRTVELRSTYYDTVDLDLLSHRVTLRRRTGDTDTGWHLKIPAGDARDELHAPLDQGVVTGADVEHPVPDDLAELLVGIVRPGEVAPVARLDTQRHVTQVRRDGELVVEIADDRVTATAGGQTDAWREVEIELGPAGDENVLDRFARALRRAGAQPSASGSKLARAMRRDLRDVSRSPAGQLVADYLGASHKRMVAGDIALRRGESDAIHSTRVATRRVRSMLREFRDAFAGGDTTGRALEAELSWYQDLLGEVRDRQVQRERFAAALAELPPQLVLGPVAARLESTLLAEQAEAMAAVTAALATNRYRRMLGAVALLVGSDPLAPKTSRASLRAIAAHSSRRAAKRLRKAQRSDDPTALHRARKAVKRARYAAELTGRSSKAVRRFKQVQNVLGDHQDAVVAAEIARRTGAVAGRTGGENGFTFGLLHQRELEIARLLRADAHHLRVPH